MKNRVIRIGILVSGLLLVQVAAASDPNADEVDFNRDIRPILSQKCLHCHGADESDRESDLRLDHREGALQELDSGERAIVPGDPKKSTLYQRITSQDESERMPPADSGKPLSDDEIGLFRRWIEQGSPYASHWSFIAPERPPLPVTRDMTWPAGGIDRFVQSARETSGLKPAPRADRYTLIRRVSFDLRGVPPTPDEVAAFVDDKRDDAYEHLVDSFLDDPAYGERWARMWLDLARYADSKGYGSDPLRTIWLYRDWVINAFNRNMPYDQFTIEQIAGDLLPNAAREQKIATAFHRNTMTNTEGGTDDEEFRVAAVKDRVDTTVQVWMGLTMGCAKCHSHKYDPITQTEYYQFFAYFNQTTDNDQPDESPVLEVGTDEVFERRRVVDTRLAELNEQLKAAKDARKPIDDEIAALSKAVKAADAEQPIDADEIPRLKRQLAQRADPKPIEAEIAQQKKQRPVIDTVPVMRDLEADKQRTTHVMIKGSFLSPGEAVGPALPAQFHAPSGESPLNRLAVAHWLIDRNNPLTARVAVNRFWAQLFGIGLVETEEDFGTQGELPSHPELLDWLAVEFMRLDWDVKALLRLMVTSETYCQSSRVTPENLIADPRNRLFSRGPRFRLEAEMVRDQALALSGLLSDKRHGPSVHPPQPPGLWRAAFNGRDRKWATSSGDDRYRRGLYTFWRRTVPYPSMATFDAPSRELCAVRRIRTNTPLQALVTLNDPVYVEAAQALARRIVREGGATADERMRFALKLCLVRPPQEPMLRQLIALLESETDHYRDHLEEAGKMATDPLGPLADDMDPALLAAWSVVANVLLNLDAVLTRG